MTDVCFVLLVASGLQESAQFRVSLVTNWTVSSKDHISSCGPGPSKGVLLGPALVQFFITLKFEEENQADKITYMLSILCENSNNIYFYLCERNYGSETLA